MERTVKNIIKYIWAGLQMHTAKMNHLNASKNYLIWEGKDLKQVNLSASAVRLLHLVIHSKISWNKKNVLGIRKVVHVL